MVAEEKSNVKTLESLMKRSSKTAQDRSQSAQTRDYAQTDMQEYAERAMKLRKRDRKKR